MTYEQALRFFGGTVTSMAEQLGLRISTVHSWRTRGIPAGRQFEIQVLTRGKLRADKKGDSK